MLEGGSIPQPQINTVALAFGLQMRVMRALVTVHAVVVFPARL